MTAKRREARGGKRRRGPASTNWVLGRRSAPFLIEKPERHRPEMLVLIDVGAGWMIALEVVEPRLPAEAVAQWADPKIENGVTVRVETEEVAQALRARLGERADVFVAPTPEVDDAMESLEEFSDRTRPERKPPHDWVDDVPDAAKAGFYEAAAQFERLEPWQAASDGHVLAIDAPALGWSGACAAVMGQAGESFGLTLFRSMDDYLQFVRVGNDPTARHRPGEGVPLLGVHFDRPRDLPGGKKLVAEARAHGFVSARSGRFPFILKSSADYVPIPTSVDDYRVATAALLAVGEFVAKHRALFERPPGERFTTSTRVETGGVEITVSAPPVDVLWHWGGEEPIEGVRRRERYEVVAAFRQAREADSAGPADVDADGWAAEEMLEFKQTEGRSLVDWTADDVAAFLLEHYPPAGATTGPEVESLPRRFEAFLAWLSSSGRGAPGRLAAARARLVELREAFLEAARDESRYGPAKLLAAQMQAEGIDMEDKEAVDACIARLHERLDKDPTLLPSFGRPRKRWFWDGTGAPPDRKEPCPCGSGRRYGKCCLPR